MFCPKCGNNVAETEQFCPVCGQNLKEQKEQKEETATTASKKFELPLDAVKKYLPIIGIVAGVLVLIIVISAVISMNSPAGVVKGYIKNMAKGNAEKADAYNAVIFEEIVKQAVDAEDSSYEDAESYLNSYYGDDVDSVSEYFEWIGENTVDSLEDEYGRDYKVKVEVIDTYKFKKAELESLIYDIDNNDEISDMIDPDSVKGGCRVLYKVTTSGKGDPDVELSYVELIKIDGKWKRLNRSVPIHIPSED